MRSREEIIKHWNQTTTTAAERVIFAELLLDIRDLLTRTITKADIDFVLNTKMTAENIYGIEKHEE